MNILLQLPYFFLTFISFPLPQSSDTSQKALPERPHPELQILFQIVYCPCSRNLATSSRSIAAWPDSSSLAAALASDVATLF